MSDNSHEAPRSQVLELGVEEMKLEGADTHGQNGQPVDDPGASTPGGASASTDTGLKSNTQSPKKNGYPSEASSPMERDHETVGGDVTVTQEPGQPPKLSRTSTQKIKARAPPLFLDAEDCTRESQSRFETISECSYTNRYIGSTEHGSMDCDCVEEWDAVAKVNAACGADSDCINRATKMECVGDCGCGAECQNQRFQQKQFAPVTVIQTDKKGYGLRADADLDPDDFIYEYIGEVIGEVMFRKRMIQYDESGIKHFYFMSLTQGEFIDATKRGNLGRFCNHSCNPNCYVDKWVVGEKLRMGIFAERKIKAGEELTFNYNVDRYGADPQPCYCEEPNCTGFIGGKTQTERATKLSHTTIEALGIDDGDGWDTAVSKRPRKKKAGEDDEEYVNNVQPKSLDEDGVTKVMATLMQSKEKWIAVKVLSRIQRSDDERVRNRVVKMHGYQIMNSNLALWKDDANVVLQIFDILDRFPRLTRNKIADSKIELTVESLKRSDDERVASKAHHLLQEWATLEVAYRIPRMKREIDSTTTPNKLNRFARRNSIEQRRVRSRSRSEDDRKSSEPPKGPSAPSGPRSNLPQRQPAYFSAPRPPYRPRPFSELPAGWFSATDDNGRTYYYDRTGKTTWQRPTAASAPPPPPPKPTGANKALEDIINEITSAKVQVPKEKASITAPQLAKQDSQTAVVHSGKEKWRNLSEEKQMKVYENTLFPHVKYVMDKFKGKLPKDDLKRFAKEISKKLVSSDFKNHRVDDPTKISSKKEKQVKGYVKEYFDKAYKKHKEREHRKVQKEPQSDIANEASANTPAAATEIVDQGSDADEDMVMTEGEEAAKRQTDTTTPLTPADSIINSEGLKRKREGAEDLDFVDTVSMPSKALRTDETPPPPPPLSGLSEGTILSPTGRESDPREVTMQDSMFSAPASTTPDDQPPPPPPPLPATNSTA